MLYSVSEPIPYNDPMETIGVMTYRSSDMLLWAYGYPHLDVLSSELPEGAAVLDVGAGASDFGHIVATSRPDITWTNFDARYGNEDISNEDQATIELMKASAPPNINYVGGNILDPPH